MIEDNDELLTDIDAFSSMLVVYRRLKAEKPEERSEKARRYAIAITELEKVMSYYLIMCSNDDFEG